MRFEYILLISLFILPIVYKLGYWQSIFMLYDNDIKKFWIFIKTKQGSDKLFHFWIFLEIPLLGMSIVPFFNPPFEVFLFNIMFYFGVLYNIFVIGKILRRKIIFPKKNCILLFTILLLLINGYFSYIIDVKYLYVYLATVVLFMPLYFIVILFIKNTLGKK